jgi:copper(I)-binding protein
MNLRALAFVAPALFALGCACVPAGVFAHAYLPDGMHIRHPWSRATPPGATVAAVYLLVRNRSARAERLLGASTPLAGRVELHEGAKDGDVSRMRATTAVTIPPNGKVEFGPSGKHLMLVELKRPLKEGERIPLVLRFERAGEVPVEVEIEALDSTGGTHH